MPAKRRRVSKEEDTNDENPPPSKKTTLLKLIQSLREELNTREDTASRFSTMTELKAAATAWPEESKALQELEDDIGKFCRGASYTGPHVKSEAIRSALQWRPALPLQPYMIHDEVYFLVEAGAESRVEKVKLTQTHADGVEFIQPAYQGNPALARRVSYSLISPFEPGLSSQ